MHLYNYGLILRISVMAHDHLFSASNWVHLLQMHYDCIIQSDYNTRYANIKRSSSHRSSPESERAEAELLRQCLLEG